MSEEGVSDPWRTTSGPVSKVARTSTPRSKRRARTTSDLTPLHRRTTPERVSERSSSSAGTTTQSMSSAATNMLVIAKFRKGSRKSSMDPDKSRLPPRPFSQPHPDRMCREDVSRTAGIATTLKYAGNTSNITESVPQRRCPLDDLVHSFKVDVDGEKLQRVSNFTSGQDENGNSPPHSPSSVTKKSSIKKSSAELDREFQQVFENLAPAPDKPETKRSTARRKPTPVEAVYFDLITLDTQGTETYSGEARSSTPSPLLRAARRRQTRLSSIDDFYTGPGTSTPNCDMVGNAGDSADVHTAFAEVHRWRKKSLAKTPELQLTVPAR